MYVCRRKATYITPCFYLQEGYKEREDRITELEEFINDQVVELDKKEAAMKQTVANKKIVEDDLRDITKSKSILENEYQKVKEVYEQTKVKWYASVCTHIHKQAYRTGVVGCNFALS